MEQAYGILSEHNLQYANDSVIMIRNYANLLVDTGAPDRAIQAQRENPQGAPPPARPIRTPSTQAQVP